MAGRDTSTVDIHVGRRLRTARIAKGISQEKLGAALGVSFQQVQKYEKGVNRIGTGRLHAIAKFLVLPLGYFFEGLDADGSRKTTRSPEIDAITKALNSREGVRIAIALSEIQSPRLRQRIADLLEEIIAKETKGVRSLVS
jgi:transcriptional regulator with XRE-family HTH domain